MGFGCEKQTGERKNGLPEMHSLYVEQSRLADFAERGKDTTDRFEVIDGFVTHPLIRPEMVIAKEFQLSIASKAIGRSTLVVLPTGIGKTIIAILVSAGILRSDGGKVVMVTPTRPLVDQHRSSFESFMTIDSMVTFTGSKTGQESGGMGECGTDIFHPADDG